MVKGYRCQNPYWSTKANSQVKFFEFEIPSISSGGFFFYQKETFRNAEDVFNHKREVPVLRHLTCLVSELVEYCQASFFDLSLDSFVDEY